MKLTDIAPDDILVFNEDLKIDDEYAINGMIGHDVFVINKDEEVVDQVNIEDLEDVLKARVLDVLENDKLELYKND